MTVPMGTEWIVDATGCDSGTLQSQASLERLLAEIVRELDLHPVASVWHVFPAPGAGVTGLVLLSESHLTIHTFPERGTAAINLYCCRPRPAWPWKARLAHRLGATHVTVRESPREGA